ncbi:protein FAM83G-like [Scyliorhinus canicula]|uniref:protein FAM83G-like n=1 Tax=Scyliorhinus canicula TaxID=7830 RepID=UPI0018F67B0F|nr:protein FAM83G-like [Scyliorhinus canicula]
MALSQLQCLDEGNVNYRTNESKPEFYYSEPQRLALETLLAGGAQAFSQTVAKENLREFLSDLDIEHILGSVRGFLPEEEEKEEGGSSSQRLEGEGEGDKEKPLSLHYWPDTSDICRPCLDLGWPDSSAYRGVTRANVYTQPPVEGSIHIKEMVRRMISHAQKVIAVVMDLFTDIDIFKDLLDASFKRKVPVYIIHDEVNIKYFLKMCERSGMHMGMLKNLRVCSIGGNEFNTRSAKTIAGRQMQKFLLIDGDRAVCGSYSFTWTASRLDRNIITVISGQAVETFDHEFRELMHFSKEVNMHKLDLAPDVSEPEPIQQVPALTAEQSAAIARKLINPKYALVRANIPNVGSEISDKKVNLNGHGKKRPNDPVKAQKTADTCVEGLITHPALLDMPKIDMFLYLPTYPEIPQNEKQQPNGSLDTKKEDVEHHGSDSVEILTRIGPHSSNQASAQQKKTACNNPDVVQAEALTTKTDPFQNHPQTIGNNRVSENKPGVNLPATNKRTKTAKAKQKPNTNVAKPGTQSAEMTATTSTQDDDKQVNETLPDSPEALENLQVDSNISTCRAHDGSQAACALEGEDHDEENIAELVTESNEAEPDQGTPPEEADVICLEDNCPSNPSTNYTGDWNTDSSSLHEQSIASSDSDDFYDCDSIDNTIKSSAPHLMLNAVVNEFTIGEVNNIVSRATFERPFNNYKQLSHSMNDVRESKITVSKDVNAFFKERAALRRKGLDKLKIALEINYQDKFQRNRYAIPTNMASSAFRPAVDPWSVHPLQNVSRSPDLNKSRRLMPKPTDLPGAWMPHTNYQKAAPRLPVTKFHEPRGDFTARPAMAESKMYSNYSGISTEADISSSSTATPLGLSYTKLTMHKNLKMKLPINRVVEISDSTPKAFTK